jgi:hypothetical protein
MAGFSQLNLLRTCRLPEAPNRAQTFLIWRKGGRLRERHGFGGDFARLALATRTSSRLEQAR